MSNRPRAEFKEGTIRLTCWQGDKGAAYSLTKRFKARDGSWQDSKVWFEGDLPKVVNLLNQCLDWLADEKKEQEKLSDMVSVPASDTEDDSNIPF